MNERFFDLKKDRQDRIINGALKVITENGYRHASTDEMVSAAAISKGLLFHYFKSKKGVYQFLYEYATRYTMIELREPQRRAGCDFFEMHRLLMRADAAVLRKYPCMPLFLFRADEEADTNGVELPEGLAGSVAACRAELLAGAQRPPFLTEADTAEISRILLYSRNGLMHELLQKQEFSADSSGEKNELMQDTDTDTSALPLHEEYIKSFSSCLQMMRRLNM